MRYWIVLSGCLLLGGSLLAADAEAARLGGGRSVGVQRSITRAPSAAPARPAQQQAAPAQNGAAQPAQPASGGLGRWMPLLGGLALGGLLGSLFGGQGLGGLLLVALLVFAVVALARSFVRGRGESRQPVQFAGAGEERIGFPRQPSQASAAQGGRIPAGFDAAGFLKGAKLNFLKLQAANDGGSLDEIREFTTNEMFDALRREAPAASQHTQIADLDADLLEVATENGRHWASVRFSGTVRETPGEAAQGFEEVWNLVKPADGSSGWLLAGIQQLH